MCHSEQDTNMVILSNAKDFVVFFVRHSRQH